MVMPFCLVAQPVARIVALAVTLNAAVFFAAPHSALAEDGAAPKHPDWTFERAREIPVQGGGRIKPLDSFAREIMLFETGSRSFQGWDPVDLIFSQLSAPDLWDNYAFIQVSREDVRRQLGLDEAYPFLTPKELRTNAVLGQYAMTSSPKAEGRSPLRLPIPRKRIRATKSSSVFSSDWVLFAASFLERAGRLFLLVEAYKRPATLPGLRWRITIRPPSRSAPRLSR